MSKVLRIDLQGAFNDVVFDDTEQLRLSLCDFHNVDWDCVDENDNEIDIFSLTLDQIMDYGEWSCQAISDEQAKDYEYRGDDE
tara:strand:+ start:155 stop:403 length:249 start_codon:yes stop_codon:yes gene_type:complete